MGERPKAAALAIVVATAHLRGCGLFLAGTGKALYISRRFGTPFAPFV
jgi:hypothetical protein